MTKVEVKLITLNKVYNIYKKKQNTEYTLNKVKLQILKILSTCLSRVEHLYGKLN